jgi:hypothetical protein
MKTLTQTPLSLFETPEPKTYDWNEIVRCDFCQEETTRARYQSNHSLIFNGWCIKAMMFHNRAGFNHEEEIAWLREHGIDPQKSRFDESHWHMENRAKYEAKL